MSIVTKEVVPINGFRVVISQSEIAKDGSLVMGIFRYAPSISMARCSRPATVPDPSELSQDDKSVVQTKPRWTGVIVPSQSRPGYKANASNRPVNEMKSKALETRVGVGKIHMLLTSDENDSPGPGSCLSKRPSRAPAMARK